MTATAEVPGGVERSPALQALLELQPEDRRKVIKSMPPRQRLRLVYDWSFWGRASQVWRPCSAMHTWYLAGRGWGKTRVGAEAVRYVADHPHLAGGRRRRNKSDRTFGKGARIGIAGRTANDVNETMLYGASGLITISPPWNRPRHFPSKKILVWPNGCVARLMSGDVPDSFRGPNFGFLWTDELAHWAKLKRSLQLMKLTHRHGESPRAVHTTTPMGVDPLIRMLFEVDEGGNPVPELDPSKPSLQGFKVRRRARIVHGSTYDNAINLAADFIEETIGEYEGTDEGDQELRGVILFQTKGAPWRRNWIQRCELDEVPDLVFVGVGVDPTVSDGERTKTDEPCECGIVAVGLGVDGRLYVLEDASGVMSTAQWADRCWAVADRWDADAFFVEDNNGGELVDRNLRDLSPRRRSPCKVRRVTATRNKYERAGLVNHLWELGRASHVGNPRRFVRLEHQQCHFDPTRPGSPSDRMDALVWAALGVAGDGSDRRRLRALSSSEAWARIGDKLRGRASSRR